MDKVQEALQKRYQTHILLFHRSLEYAKTNGELFDILETMPKQMPIVWDQQERTWVQTSLLQQKSTSKKGKK